MNVPTLVRDALNVGAAAVLLSACGTSSIPSAATGASGARTSDHEMRFKYTGARQKFVVPSGVTQLTVVAYGAQGGGDTQGRYVEPPGLGGEISAVVPVQPGETLYVFVGGAGRYGTLGGYNGGGQGGYSEYVRGFGGGGASDVREGGKALRDRIVVAGGAGGAGGGYYFSGAGGAGGGLSGGNGCCASDSYDGMGGSGATQTGDGSGGEGGGTGAHAGQAGSDGARGSGGDGGESGARGPGYDGGFGGAGGGGGYYGGGGGGGGAAYGSCSCRGGYGGGGGGGSSYVEPKAKHFSTKSGVRKHDGLVIISW